MYGGGKIDVPSAAEIATVVGGQLREMYRGVKWMRLPETLRGTAASGVLTLGIEAGEIVGPDQGYVWALTRLVVDGLTGGAVADTVNLYRNSSAGQAPLWAFNGNNFAYTFDPGQMTLMPGDTLRLISQPTFTATGLIRLSGELVEVPAEMLPKLVIR